jgi:hypothetical protein
MNTVPRRDGGNAVRAQGAPECLIKRCAGAFGGSETLEEAVGKRQTPFARCVGYRTSSGGELLARATPKIALIGLHSRPPRTSTLARVA